MDNLEKMLQAVMNAHSDLSEISAIDCAGLTTSQASTIELQRLKIHKQMSTLEKMIQNFKDWNLQKNDWASLRLEN